MTPMERERFRMLMTKALDGELADSETSEFESFLQDEENWQEWKSYSKIKEATMALKISSPNGEVWDRYWGGVYNRLERGIAWTLIAVGALLLTAWGLWELAAALWIDTTVPVVVKAGIVLLCGGGMVLFYTVARERWFTRKSDKYKEVIR